MLLACLFLLASLLRCVARLGASTPVQPQRASRSDSAGRRTRCASLQPRRPAADQCRTKRCDARRQLVLVCSRPSSIAACRCRARRVHACRARQLQRVAAPARAARTSARSSRYTRQHFLRAAVRAGERAAARRPRRLGQVGREHLALSSTAAVPSSPQRASGSCSSSRHDQPVGHSRRTAARAHPGHRFERRAHRVQVER